MERYLKRQIEEVFATVLRHFPVVLITGPRQAGKSTLLQHVLKGYTYVSFDNADSRKLAESDPELFLNTYKAPLILDEIQYVPSLFSHIKIRVDQNRRSYGQYVLTGSQIFSLMSGVSESLAGRIMILSLYPLSWDELPHVDSTDERAIFRQMLRGFYPELQLQPDLEPKFWYSSYLTTYLERDMRVIRQVHDLNAFQTFLVLLAARAGQILNLHEISKECGISHTTAKSWLTVLQASMVIHRLEPYARNMTKRVIKSPKVYFTDTGFLCYLLRIETIEQIVHSPFAGHIFENMVIMDVIKQFANRGDRPPCYFHRTSHGSEVDLLIDQGSHLDAYEIKFSASPRREMATGLRKFMEDQPVGKAAVLNLRKEPLPLTDRISACHWRNLRVSS